MQAVKGYIDNGRFTPHDFVRIPKRASVVLVFNDTTEDEDKAGRMAFLRDFHRLAVEARGEEMPDFPRASFARQLVDLSDEG